MMGGASWVPSVILLGRRVGDVNGDAFDDVIFAAETLEINVGMKPGAKSFQRSKREH
jgi:hypothetical protein